MNAPLHVEVSDLAAGQIRLAEAWWRIHRSKAPNAIREELERVSALIAVRPDIGALARGIALQGVRRIHMRRIRYYLYYRIGEMPNQVDILGFWHSSRRDEPPI
jgi:hypothetical protein